ncbi:hypothetical protein [Wolbachia endosymbiont of Dactylopius coccus]
MNGYGFSSPPCCIEKSLDSNLHDNVEYLLLSSQWDLLFHVSVQDSGKTIG